MFIQENLEKLALIEIEQVPEDLEQTMQAIDLLRQVDASIMLISFILCHRFGSFLVLLLNFIEYLL